MTTTYFNFFCASLEASIWIENFITCKVWKKNKQRVRFKLEKNKTRQVLKYFFRLVRFWMKNLTTCRILNWNFFIFSNLKVYPSPTTCTFHIVFFHKTMYSYSLQYLRKPDNSIRHRSNNTSCTHFRKDLDFWFCYGVPLSSGYGLDICRNLLLL